MELNEREKGLLLKGLESRLIDNAKLRWDLSYSKQNNDKIKIEKLREETKELKELQDKIRGRK